MPSTTLSLPGRDTVIHDLVERGEAAAQAQGHVPHFVSFELPSLLEKLGARSPDYLETFVTHAIRVSSAIDQTLLNVARVMTSLATVSPENYPLERLADDAGNLISRGERAALARGHTPTFVCDSLPGIITRLGSRTPEYREAFLAGAIEAALTADIAYHGVYGRTRSIVT